MLCKETSGVYSVPPQTSQNGTRGFHRCRFRVVNNCQSGSLAAIRDSAMIFFIRRSAVTHSLAFRDLSQGQIAAVFSQELSRGQDEQHRSGQVADARHRIGYIPDIVRDPLDEQFDSQVGEKDAEGMVAQKSQELSLILPAAHEIIPGHHREQQAGQQSGQLQLGAAVFDAQSKVVISFRHLQRE